MASIDRLEYKDDYVQSANSLFHFMNEERFLTDAIDRCALIPRYCKENIEYMDLKDTKGKTVKEMAVLQKCFCDIPFHKINESFPVDIVNDVTEETRKKVLDEGFNTHTKLYGAYGIAFSKKWCYENGFQPILYVNEKSEYLMQLKKLYAHIMSKDDDVDIEFIEDLLRQFAYMKPLNGIMSRTCDGANVDFRKNFHDEKEWRFIPTDNSLKKCLVDKISFKQAVIENYVNISNNLEAPSYEQLWLKFTYDDVKYIIVPHRISREHIIKYILNMPKEKFSDEFERMMLISKIQVLEDIGKDW